MSNTKIEWADRVWNPVTGCTKVSAGCTRCYAEKFAKRLQNNPKAMLKYMNGFTPTVHYDELSKPETWQKPSRIFVCSMGDLFHEDVPFEFIDKVFATISRSWWHIFIVLTKRAERMEDYFAHVKRLPVDVKPQLPIPNLWLGVSAETQKTYDDRVPHLLRIPAAIRFVSLEPLLEKIHVYQEIMYGKWDLNQDVERTQKIHWVIVGGESGSGARPVHPQWIKELQFQCHASGFNDTHTPFFFKSWGEYFPGPLTNEELLKLAKEYPKARISSSHTFPDGQVMFHTGHKASGRLLNGKEYLEFPEL